MSEATLNDLEGSLRLVDVADLAVLTDRAVAEAPGPADLPRRRQQLLASLAARVGADAWVWTLQQLAPPELDAAYFGMIDAGWAREGQKLAWLEGTFSPEFWQLLAPVADRLGGPLTVTRSELLDDGAWYRSDFYRQHRQPAGLDDFLLSFHPVAPGLQSVVRLHRFAGHPAFGTDEQRGVHELCTRVPWLHAPSKPAESLPSTHGLSPREKQVLLLLLQGDSKKEIAGKLALSEHTVGDYTKSLHDHFDVQSRGELLALFIPRAQLEALK